MTVSETQPISPTKESLTGHISIFTLLPQQWAGCLTNRTDYYYIEMDEKPNQRNKFSEEYWLYEHGKVLPQTMSEVVPHSRAGLDEISQ